MRAHGDLARRRLRRQPQPDPAGHRRGLPLILAAALLVAQRRRLAGDAAGPQAGQQRHGHEVAVARAARDRGIECHRRALPGTALQHRPGEGRGRVGALQFGQRQRAAGVDEHDRSAGMPRGRQVHRRRTRPGLADQDLELRQEALESVHGLDRVIGKGKPKFSVPACKNRCRGRGAQPRFRGAAPRNTARTTRGVGAPARGLAPCPKTNRPSACEHVTYVDGPVGVGAPAKMAGTLR